MLWLRISAAAALAAASLSTGAAPSVAQTPGGQCRVACNTAHAACMRRAINASTCQRRFAACKKKCDERPMSEAPAPAAEPEPTAEK